jgi:tetratricopeptide (TPR) repeat protein
MESTRLTIRIDSEIKDNRRSVYFDDAFSHYVEEKDLQEVIQDAGTNLWKTRIGNGQGIGNRLYKMINGSDGKLMSAIKESHDNSKPLLVYLKLPPELSCLPFELFYDNRFLLMDSRVHLMRRVNDENRSKKETPERRPLKALFMACSPTDLKAHEVLSFEKEEELIIETVGDYPLSLTIEDSGSINGLEHAIYEADGYDVVHITGHAGIDDDYGPVFYMENDIGETEKVTALMLWEKIKAFPPKILFLSGCSTAKTDTENASESFAHLMIEQGIPVALGWGLPISDTGATTMAARIYKYLSMGKNIGEAVQTARQEMETAYHVWPLLRLYTDGAPLTPVVASGQALFKKTPRATTYKYLKDSQVKVLEKGFVGRRRQIQKGVKVLKGAGDKCGILIHGTAGLGKSCLAGKLIERFNKKELMVIHGELRTSDLFPKLLNMFDRKGTASGIQIMKSDIEPDEKIKHLFRTSFKEQPALLYLDDFEQNLERRGDEWYVKPDAIELMKTILTALDWSEGITNLMITSRYPFVLEAQGENLPDKRLEEISLMSFKGADLRKKKEELEYISKSKHAEMYMQSGCGNPRLLEWLDKIAEEENKYDLQGLKQGLAGRTEDFISEYLADVIAKTQGADFHNFLHKASVFRQPVENAAYHRFGSDELLNKGVDLTLFEKEQITGQKAVFWVTPVIRARMFDKLDESNKTELHKTAYDWYDERLHGSKEPDPVYLEEAIHHALESGNIRGACKHAIPLALFMKAILLYRDETNLLQTVADRITSEVINEAKNYKDNNVPTLYNNLGGAWSDLGDNKKAIDYYTKALEIFSDVYGSEHPHTKIVRANLDALKG